MWRKLIVVGLAALCSCQEPIQEAPLQPAEMINVLTDIRILEGSYAAAVTKPDTLRPYMSKYYDQLFAKHGIDHDRYYKAYDYYMSRPDLMEAIEDSVINRISDRLNKTQ